ncbi:hypothetical protein Poly51_04000 [Rubripirellula tenax]|uniref:Uncharacterized protein n=1 Tax=Rubripirellula tenax TaxID=2528015 RepID=A0A5C6FE85_9BACT|nr:hypothetical protein [Rubripirellula tenax]TWU60126.1 hypothetical protein Poly51_04000 [Rubripirellula tenax]
MSDESADPEAEREPELESVSPEQPTTPSPTSPPQPPTKGDDGPGWMPAILAATALMGIAGFVFCGFSTWLLFQKRTEFAIRTLRDAYIPELEQSLLEPDEKQLVIKQVTRLVDEMQRGKYENWQSAGILQRLQRLPVIQWGELYAVDAAATKNASPEVAAETSKQLSRLRRSVEVGKTTSFDFEDVLTPVYIADSTRPGGHRLQQPIDVDAIIDVVQRARLVADREKVPDESFSNARIEAIVREQINAGVADGGF